MLRQFNDSLAATAGEHNVRPYTRKLSMPIIRPIAFGVAGLLYALGIAFVALLMSGAGHGWVSVSFCWLSVFLLPLLGAALGLKNTFVRIFLLWVVVIGMFGVDFQIIRATQDEGWGYAVRAWKSIPDILTLWVVAWFAWQGFAILLLARMCMKSMGEQDGAANGSPPSCPVTDGTSSAAVSRR